MDHSMFVRVLLCIGVSLAANVDISMFLNPSTIVPNVQSNPANTIRSCYFEGKAGECVPSYLCDDNNKIITDGFGLLDERFGTVEVQADQCTKNDEVCCLLGTKRDEGNPITIPPPPAREGCGWHNPEGVGMKTKKLKGETNFGEYPWMIRLLFNNATEVNFLGGGSLIHPNVVLTAAHLVHNLKDKLNQIIVRAGEWNTQTEAEIYKHQDRKVASIEVHKDFIRGNLFYDIALIFLQEPFDLTQPHINLACLPPQSNEATVPGTRCTAIGWGKDKFERTSVFHVALKKVELPVVNSGDCRDILRKTHLGKKFELHTSFMCAGGEPGIDTCTGDGGSPLNCPIEDDPGRYMQSGIVAWGIGCGANNVPGVYVNVGRLRKWIDEKVDAKGYEPNVYTI